VDRKKDEDIICTDTKKEKKLKSLKTLVFLKVVLTNVGNVPHDNVDESVLHEGEEHKHRAPRHEHVDGLENVYKFKKSLLSINIHLFIY
jgi:hypothetical protein